MKVENVVFFWALFLFVVEKGHSQEEQTTVGSLEEEEYPDIKEDSENVCIDQKLENVVINVSYMQTIDVKEYTWCLAVPPRCPVFKQKLVESSKKENVSRLVNHRKCCPGYRVSNQKNCEPICDEPCEHGFCYEPNVCSCLPGFSGPQCESFGCPGGNWGKDCTNKCPCVNGGSCEATTGKCLCLPGYSGLHCQTKCDPYHYGADCNKKCECKGAGEKCYHVTGDCLPCSPGTFGAYCAQDCSCNSTGTALCYHLNGNCFCHSNWYGPRCDLYCPFGYVNGVCYNEPMNNETACSCPGDMYECDPKLGCICNEDKNCQGGQQIFSLAPLSAADETSTANSSSVAIIVTVLIIALLCTILGVWYYRRRTKVLQKDLQNRSVYYVENSILDPTRHHHNQNDLVVSNSEPNVLDDSEGPALFVGATAAATSTPSNVSQLQNNLLAKPRYEKNVNIDAFKLGMEEAQTGAAAGRSTPSTVACGRSTPMSGGACGSLDDDAIDFPAIAKKPLNVNMFDEDETPVKSNNRKINKPKINNLLNNTNNSTSVVEEDDEDEDVGGGGKFGVDNPFGVNDNDDDDGDDEMAIVKMSNYLGSYDKN